MTLCLVAHELPADATANIFREAYRLLRPGGTLSVMEVRRSACAWCTWRFSVLAQVAAM